MHTWVQLDLQAGSPLTAGGDRDVQVGIVQLLAVLMGGAHSVVWVLVSRRGRPGRTARLRARLSVPPLAVRGGYVALVVPLLYPAVVAIAPGRGYEGRLNWWSRFDRALPG